MSLSVVCYPTPGKAKARRLLEAFAQGAGGRVAAAIPARLEDGAAAFYGVTAATKHLWHQARTEQRPRFYLDNAYFDAGREKYFRATCNALQAFELLPPAPERFARLGVAMQPWRRDGRHIVVCPQSDEFMRTCCNWAGGAVAWLEEVLQTLNAHTDRPIVVRHWQRNKASAAASLGRELKGAWALVTHMSAAANEALVAGVPVFVTGLCAATPMASGALAQIEKPLRPDGRLEWAAGLAGAQWTVEEMKIGRAWRALGTEEKRDAA